MIYKQFLDEEDGFVAGSSNKENSKIGKLHKFISNKAIEF
jgi:hypothetical protein